MRMHVSHGGNVAGLTAVHGTQLMSVAALSGA